jgi:hypothetical protein
MSPPTNEFDLSCNIILLSYSSARLHTITDLLTSKEIIYSPSMDLTKALFGVSFPRFCVCKTQKAKDGTPNGLTSSNSKSEKAAVQLKVQKRLQTRFTSFWPPPSAKSLPQPLSPEELALQYHCQRSSHSTTAIPRLRRRHNLTGTRSHRRLSPPTSLSSPSVHPATVASPSSSLPSPTRIQPSPPCPHPPLSHLALFELSIQKRPVSSPSSRRGLSSLSGCCH